MNLTVLGMKVRIACSSLIYRRSLDLTRSTLQKTTMGQLINLLSNDVGKFDVVFPFINTLWIAPLAIVALFYYIDATIGPGAMAGLSIVFLCLVAQSQF